MVSGWPTQEGSGRLYGSGSRRVESDPRGYLSMAGWRDAKTLKIPFRQEARWCCWGYKVVTSNGDLQGQLALVAQTRAGWKVVWTEKADAGWSHEVSRIVNLGTIGTGLITEYVPPTGGSMDVKLYLVTPKGMSLVFSELQIVGRPGVFLSDLDRDGKPEVIVRRAPSHAKKPWPPTYEIRKWSGRVQKYSEYFDGVGLGTTNGPPARSRSQTK